ncbi:MAG TPA: carboxymuconolactone decarboxylase family protein [Chthoniobacterales bacterium]
MATLPFDPDKLSDADRTLYENLAERRKQQGAPFGGPYLALMNYPHLCKRIEDLGFYLKFQGRLPREVYQFIVLSVARHCGAAFEWADHVEHARAAGVPEAVIESLHSQGAEGMFSAPYALVARILAHTLPWKNVPEDIQNAAIETYGTDGFIEIVVVSGFYQMFSAINQGFDIQPKAQS